MKLFKSEIEKVTLNIESDIKKMISDYCEEKFWVTHYGANDIHPKHLVYWVCVKTDKEKNKLDRDPELMRNLKSLLRKHNYPLSGRDEVFIGYESQETVDRESNGHWWNHWK